MTKEEALQHAEREQKAYQHKIDMGMNHYSQLLEYQTIVVNAIKESMEEDKIKENFKIPENKYRWHSIKSKELPEDDCTVRICFRYPHSKERLYGKCFYRMLEQDFQPFNSDVVILAWKYEEPFTE